MIRICPICGREYDDYPAISRKDNKTEICPDCGIFEAVEAFVEQTRKDWGEENEDDYYW